MNTKILLIMVLSFIMATSAVQAELDFGQEVINIPDTHNEKPYIWDVKRAPKDYTLSLDPVNATAGRDSEFTLAITSKSGERIEDIHVFITDKQLHAYKHLRPKYSDGKYTFTYNAPWAGKYRIEVAFKTEKGWVDLRKDIKVKGDIRFEDYKEPQEDDGYKAVVKTIPQKAYAEHVVTILYELSYKGEPLALEKIDGVDLRVAVWDEDLREFIYAVPGQNLGGPRVAVSIVPMRPGKHAIFAEFSHKGVMKTVDLFINVHEEPKDNSNSLRDLKPSDG